MAKTASKYSDGSFSLHEFIDTAFEFRRSDHPNEGFTFLTYERPCENLSRCLPDPSSIDGCIRFHRAEFLDVLVDNLPSGVAHFGKKLVNYVEAAPGIPMTLHFADGSVDTCNLLVGCDGIKSTIRRQLYADVAKREGKPNLLCHIEPMWTGTSVYRGLIPLDQLPTSANGEPHRATSTPVMVSIFLVFFEVITQYLVLW